MRIKTISKFVCAALAASVFDISYAEQWSSSKSYSEGDQVTSLSGNVYECKGWPYTGWCSGNTAYEPE
ncbi:hypothetical protein OAO18_09175, partial [Francisellaceae bacterium]|nr:hypothetical protein [Francisellaceae bacterium]